MLELLKKQRDFFIRDNKGNKIITNPLLYYSLEDELARVQEKIGRENKKLIKKECDEEGVEYPNFRKEVENKR